MAEKFVGKAIDDPRERLVARVATNLLQEPNYYSSADQKRVDLLADVEVVAALDPEFICKLAYYSREKLNIRTTSNFLLAFAAARPQTKHLLPTYFRKAVRLPNDLLEVVQFLQELSQKHLEAGHYYVPKCLQREVRLKFKEFSVYQLGKYCSEGKRKRQTEKAKAEEAKGKKSPEKLQLAMKKLVRLCHISEPADLVCSVLGKHYPATEEEFKASSLFTSGGQEASFDPSKAHKRMKIPTPVTWETELSAGGNNAAIWERLIKERKLPFMAMVRNIRNLLITGVDAETHQLVIARLQDPQQVAQSRLFPFRFFSAFDALKINLEDLQRLKEDPLYEPPKPEGKRGKKKPKKKNVPLHKIIPQIVPTPAVIEAYRSALEISIRLATTSNVQPVLGHSVIFCDVSGSMQTPLSGGTGLGSVRTCKEAGVLLGLMLRYACESVEVIAFSSPGSHEKCWFPIILRSENILENMASVFEQASVLGGGTDFPYDFVWDLINEKKHVDQMFIFSDMMIAPGQAEMENTTSGGAMSISQVLNRYRVAVNPNMKFVTVDLATHGRNILGAELKDDFRNVEVHGYSDSILALVSELQKSQIQAVESFAQELIDSNR